MRICYLHQYFKTPSMSGGTRSYEMARRLVAAGHEVTMVTSDPSPTATGGTRITIEEGIEVHWIPVPYSNSMPYPRRIRAFLSFALRAARVAAAVPSDLVFATSTPLTIALPAAYAAARRRAPLVFEVRDLWPALPLAMGALRHPLLRFAARRLERFAYARSTRVVALSPGMRAGIESAGFPGERIATIPNGADLELFERRPEEGRAFRREHGIPEDAVAVLYAGTFGRINGVEHLVQIAEELRGDPRVHFLLVGDGFERQRVELAANEAGVLGRTLTLLPPLPKSEVRRAFWACEMATSLVIPLPELEANSANKFFDGLAAGCCIAVNYGGWHEQLLAEHDAGFRLPRDPAAAAASLRAWCDRPQRLAEAGRNARRLAEERFSRDRLARELEVVLVDAVEAHRSASCRRG